MATYFYARAALPADAPRIPQQDDPAEDEEAAAWRKSRERHESILAGRLERNQNRGVKVTVDEPRETNLSRGRNLIVIPPHQVDVIDREERL